MFYTYTVQMCSHVKNVSQVLQALAKEEGDVAG